uniref:protein acetyllysine N-acetyltransferase n=1 Tax=Phallusia mammillata TaxID=59560 RepID=A0A6F9DSU0_9ASCI|nr:NAD-dependent protein deacetylase sirtuin-1-like [Phallusia mammillata]
MESFCENSCGTPVKKRRTVDNDNKCDTKDSDFEKPSNILMGATVEGKKEIDRKLLDCEPTDKIQHSADCETEPSSPASSTASESDWHPSSSGCYKWMHEQMLAGTDPREILQKILPTVEDIPQEIDNWSLWRLVIHMMSEPPRRSKLPNINTFSDAVNLIRSSKKIIVLTGAGVSVSCGIPDFRSRDGVYARLAVDFPDLPSPESMFDISYFRQDPRPFFKFAKEIYPGQYKPSRIHRFIAMLDSTGRLLRNYTQNIDTLEQVAGIKNVVQCHGSFATASCQICKYKTDCETIREDIFNQVIPRCPNCTGDEPGILKPDIVFFGENLPDHFHRQMVADKEEADLLIVIGSALKVRPVALIPSSIPAEVPQILINREALNHLTFDVDLLGDGDTIVAEICRSLGDEFASLVEDTEELNEITSLPDASNTPEKQVSEQHDSTVETPDTSVFKSKCDMTSSSNGDVITETTLQENREENLPLTDKQQKTSKVLQTVNSGNRDAFDSNHDMISGENSENVTSCESSSNVSQKNAVITGSTNHDHAVNGTGNEAARDTSRNAPMNVDKIDDQTSNHEIIKNSTDSESIAEISQNDSYKKKLHDREDKTVSSQDVNSKEDSAEKIAMRGFWQSRWKQSISKRLPAGCYYYDGKHRYIFPGAEVPPEEESDSSSDEDDSNGTSSSEDSVTGVSPLRRHPLPQRPRANQWHSATSSHSLDTEDATKVIDRPPTTPI